LEGEAESLYVTDRVATCLKASRSSERDCEPTVVHMTWLGSCYVFHKLMYKLQQLTVLSFRYCTDRINYFIAVLEETRKAIYL
jgi:hypothetical protein